MKYSIGVKEVWEQIYEVEASSEKEAVQKLKDYKFLYTCSDDVELIENLFEFSHELDSEHWTVYETK